MEEYPNKLSQIAETLIHLIVISTLVVITALPVFTVGTAVTSGYRVLIMLSEREIPITFSDIVKIYFKCFIKRIVPTTLITMWIILIFATISKAYTFISINIISLTFMFLIVIEVLLFFQIIYILVAEDFSLKYFESIKKTFYLTNQCLHWILLMVGFMVIFVILVMIFRWSIIIMPGLYLKLNLSIYENKIKPKLLKV